MSLAKTTSDSEDDSSVASSSEESSSESDMDGDDKPSAPAQTAPAEGLLLSGCIITDRHSITSEQETQG